MATEVAKRPKIEDDDENVLMADAPAVGSGRENRAQPLAQAQADFSPELLRL